MNKGEVSLDTFASDHDLLENRELWGRVLKNVRAGIMPPAKKPHPSEGERKQIADWIKTSVFNIDPANPDPGRITIRRLNRVEYRNTIRDLLGVDFNTDQEFPPDDTGYGFDTIGDVLTVSPMLLEKYIAAAKTVIAEAVPTQSKVIPERIVAGKQFLRGNSNDSGGQGNGKGREGMLSLSFYDPVIVTNVFKVDQSGDYKLGLNFEIKGNNGERGFDSNKCQVVFKVDGRELLRKEWGWQERKELHFDFDQKWTSGEHLLAFEVEPTTPGLKKNSALEMRLVSTVIQGPADEKYWIKPKNYDRYFTKDDPKTPAARRKYARELLAKFAKKAFRRPVDDATVDRLTALAERVYSQPGKTFEAGVAHGMVAVLASPQFLFREENIESNRSNKSYPLVDEFALASRLSYFLWSSMPDDELFRLAQEKKLRKNLASQMKRLMADPRSEAFIQNFSGQWLEARDIETVQVDARSVLARDDSSGERNKNRRFSFGRPRVELDSDLRKAMRQETEMYFGNIVKEDRSVLELIESDYTFLNEKLAKYYGITNVTVAGAELRKVSLPPDSPRGGVLTQGSVLAVTSNPTRTSPVKRGLFVLENFLGIPPAPPPPDIPPLEDSEKGFKDREPTLREVLEIHRAKPLCSSCHNRMDPLGLAFENFNAMGLWREKEMGQPIDATGQLITGEPFKDIRGVKHILATQHRLDFYRTLTEKLLTYALGRGLEYYDVLTVDQIVDRLDKENGRFSALLMGIVESAPLQKRRNSNKMPDPGPIKPQPLRAELKERE